MSLNLQESQTVKPSQHSLRRQSLELQPGFICDTDWKSVNNDNSCTLGHREIKRKKNKKRLCFDWPILNLTCRTCLVFRLAIFFQIVAYGLVSHSYGCILFVMWIQLNSRILYDRNVPLVIFLNRRSKGDRCLIYRNKKKSIKVPILNDCFWPL